MAAFGGNEPQLQVDVRQLRAFVTLVEQGSVRRAARALGLAQSTVSEALTALDRAVGSPVIARRRGAHRLPLTDVGDALLPHARAILRTLEDAAQSVAEVTARARATVEVLTVESLSTYLLPPVLGALRRRWPNTRFAVTVATCATIRDAAATGRCDIGVTLEFDHAPRAGTVATSAVIAEGVPLVAFCSPAHALAGLRQNGTRDLPPGELAPYPIYISDAVGDLHDVLRRYLHGNGIGLPRLEAAGSVEATRRIVAADERAIGVMPLYAVAADARAGRLHLVRLAPPPPPMRITALLPGTNHLHPAALALVDGLRCELGTVG